MLTKLRSHLTYANVVATMALFLVVAGGVAWALAPNSVKSKHIKDGQVKAADLGADSVSSSNVAADSLTAGDLASGAVGASELADGAVSEAKLAPPGGFTSAGLDPSDPNCIGAANEWATVSPDVNNDTSYHRDRNGFVHLRGVPITCGAPTSGETIFTLPAGSTPEGQEVQIALYETGPGRVDINPNGDVVAASSPVSGTWVSLDGITFRCAPSGSNGCP